MRIDEVVADAFGPFVKKRYRFAPRMTVVFGPNEAGKSSLHAALYAGLCGRRRGRGQRGEDQDFAASHRPWDGTGRWAVGAVVTLTDDRRIELQHDLEGKVACRATDDFGRDVSGEIIHDGSPDGSRWVGLDRQSFLSTACVGQADVFAVVEDASQLQEELQRAAATAGKDETAARALALIDEFRRENVGKDQANSTKPLRRAKERLANAQADLEGRKKDHYALTDLSTRLDLAAAGEREARFQVQLLEAALARRQASLLSAKLQRVKELSSRFAAGPPPNLPDDDELADSVARALQAWTKRPSISTLSGPTSEELESALERLPLPPEGDRQVHRNVSVASDAYLRSIQAVELHELAKPEMLTSLPDTRASAEDLLSLARDLATVEPAVDADLEKRIERLRQQLESSTRSRTRRRILLALGAAIASAGALALILGATAVGSGLLALGVVGCAVLLLTGGERLRAHHLEQLLVLEGTYGERRHAIAAAREIRTTAGDRAKTLGLPADPELVRRAASDLTSHEQLTDQVSSWERRKRSLQETLRQAEATFSAALLGRGEGPGEDILQRMENYRSACARRAALAQQADERPALEGRLADRLAAERSTLEAVTLRDAAEAKIREVARRCGQPDSKIESLVGGLELWKSNRQESRIRRETNRREWSTLVDLMSGKTLNDIGEEANEALNHAENVCRGLDDTQVDAVPLDGHVTERLPALRSQLEETARNANELKGKLAEQMRRVQSVAEAEEALSRAETELARIQKVDATLTQTQDFLERAQERVHRSIAPALREALNRWLPRVTNGRYTEAVVDPKTLEVKVRGAGGTWREAELLSRGTAEQVYLLLRIALVEHLTRPSGEVCPLILDDVMVQSDETRKAALLELLHEVSAERQVILFTMEPSVADWARNHLREPEDLLICLDGSDIAA